MSCYTILNDNRKLGHEKLINFALNVFAYNISLNLDKQHFMR